MFSKTQSKTISVLAALGLIGSLATAVPAMADGFHSGVVIDIRDGFHGNRGFGYRDVDFRGGDRIFDRIERMRDRIRHEIHEGELAHGRGFGRGDRDGRGWGDRDEGYRHRF